MSEDYGMSRTNGNLLEDMDESMDPEALENLVRSMATRLHRIDEEAELRGELLREMGVTQKDMSSRINLLSSALNGVRTDLKEIRDLLTAALKALSNHEK